MKEVERAVHVALGMNLPCEVPCAAVGATGVCIPKVDSPLIWSLFRAGEATETAFTGGWFRSREVGVMHPDGHVEQRDRKKDIPISGGEHISTIEVEQAVVSHPAVLEAAVVAIADEKWGEVHKAFVRPKPGPTLAVEALMAHCRSGLPGFKVPKTVEFGELPKTSTGKVQKFVLRDREWAARDKRIS